MKKLIKKGIVLIIPVIIIGALFIFSNAQPEAEKGIPLEFSRKNTFDRKEDDWIYTFEINYPNTNEKNNYIFDAYNLKYKESDEHYIPAYDEYGKESYRIKPEYLSFSNSIKYKEDVKNINEYFNKKQFDREITNEDLSELRISYIDKNYLVDIFNRTVTSTAKNTAGEYYNSSFIGRVNQESTDSTLPGEWQATYILDFGHIYDVNIQFIDKNRNYLSDKEIEKISSTEKSILSQIDTLKKESIQSQKKVAKSSKNTTNKDLQTLMEKLQKELIEN